MMKIYASILFFVFLVLSTTIASAQQNSLNFDGEDDYIFVPYSATHDVSNAVTVEAWVNPNNNNWHNILMKGNYGYGFALSGYGGPGSCGSTGHLVFWDQSQCGSTIRSLLTYSLNAWQHAAVTVTDIGSQLEIYFYVDGIQDGPYISGASEISNGGIDNSIYIGTQGLGLGNSFGGNMDELRVWTVARSQSDIQSTMNAELSPPGQPDLALYYSFNQGIGGGDNSEETSSTDRTTNNNNGTLVNFTLNGNTSNWVGESPAVLPVRLLSFRAAINAEKIELSWSTAQEQNSNRFEIQRSINGNGFMNIGTVASAGNSNYRLDYHFTDEDPVAGNNYYRLKQIDVDDRFVYSSIIKQTISATQLQLLSNPVKTELKAVFHSKIKGELRLVIADISGAVIFARTIAVQGGANQILIPLGEIKSGSYFLQASSGNWKTVIKFSKIF